MDLSDICGAFMELCNLLRLDLNWKQIGTFCIESSMMNLYELQFLMKSELITWSRHWKHKILSLIPEDEMEESHSFASYTCISIQACKSIQVWSKQDGAPKTTHSLQIPPDTALFPSLKSNISKTWSKKYLFMARLGCIGRYLAICKPFRETSKRPTKSDRKLNL
jgi:hypothetical protein